MGQHDYRLKSLADDELLAELSSIVGRRNQITAEFLAYLAELDERQLFLDLGFASLFFASREDTIAKASKVEALATQLNQAGRACKFVEVPNGDHYSSMIDQGVPSAISWMQSLL